MNLVSSTLALRIVFSITSLNDADLPYDGPMRDFELSRRVKLLFFMIRSPELI